MKHTDNGEEKYRSLYVVICLYLLNTGLHRLALGHGHQRRAFNCHGCTLSVVSRAFSQWHAQSAVTGTAQMVTPTDQCPYDLPDTPFPSPIIVVQGV